MASDVSKQLISRSCVLFTVHVNWTAASSTMTYCVVHRKHDDNSV